MGLSKEQIKNLILLAIDFVQTQTQSYTQVYTYTPPVFSYFDCDNFVTTQISKSVKKTKLCGSRFFLGRPYFRVDHYGSTFFSRSTIFGLKFWVDIFFGRHFEFRAQPGSTKNTSNGNE